MQRLVVDTSVVIEYVNEAGALLEKAARLFEKAITGNIELYVTPLTLSEVLYVASRVYQAAGVADPNGEAARLARWLTSIARMVALDERIALRAGELKKMLRISLADCYVIASAVALGATPLFRHAEAEMRPVLAELRRLGSDSFTNWLRKPRSTALRNPSTPTAVLSLGELSFEYSP